ncbi:hypothetical protein [Flagellimonas flava]|uniref:Uncharacterized protein n=1 Tax=Flagellimonas flava TaxID=570519 RepID=A0A1M5K6G9_9FLAO|nr:hypothetical protein [Allomuricauda flava]SHG48412.1 hypothetical protein SAMN04488116_1410 [Allomuricauda flava]
MKESLVVVLTLLVGTFGFGQGNLLTESETHIFWQPDKKLKQTDFKADATKIQNAIRYCDTVGLCTVASLGVFAVLDIPKKKKQRGRLREKVYVAPAFEFSTSYIVRTDSLGIEKQQVVFDMYELSARYIRKELGLMLERADAYGTLSIWLKTIENDAQKLRTEMVDSYTKDVYINNRPGAYLEWKEKVDSTLNDLKEFATKPEDCHRFVTKQPLDDKYKMAKTVVGRLFE